MPAVVGSGHMDKTVLLVEDEQVLRESMAELLEGEGYRVIQAANGKIAHDLIRAWPRHDAASA